MTILTVNDSVTSRAFDANGETLWEQRPWFALLLLIGLVFAAAFTSIAFSRLMSQVALIWPANAIVLNALLRSSQRRWIGYVLGGLIGICAANFLARDITKEQAAEDALRASQEKFSTIFQASPDGVAIADAGSGSVLEINDRFEETTGRSRSEILGRTIVDLGVAVDPSIRDQWLDQLRRVGSIRDVEYQVRRQSGEVATMVMSADLIEVGGRQCFLSVHRDITDKKRVEEALHRTEAKYRELVENANDMIFTVDRDGFFLSMNRAGQEISGYSADDPRGTALSHLIAPEQAEMARRQLQRVLDGEDVPTFELDIVNKQGKRITLELAARPIYEGGSAVAAQGIARDVTRRKELETQLRQAQKMQAIGSLAGGIAHDFNNLLTAVLGYADLASQQLDPDSPVRKDVEEIERAARSAESLTRQLLIFSRKGVVQPAVLDLNEIVGRLNKMLLRIVGEQIEFIVRPGHEVGHIKADEGQIEQVIMNLVVNARDAMPTGGTLKVETDTVELGEPFARLHPELSPGAFVRLTVSDTGVGMTPDVRAQLFTPFFTTKGPTKGTGLGLATVHGIVQQAGGCVAVESAPGQGATFTVYLPRVAEAVETVAVTAPSIAAPVASETILFVEDDESIRELGARVLRQHGYTVLPARHATEAMKLAERLDRKIDLLLTDIVMPGLDGRALAQHLRQSRGDLKLLYTSGYTDDSAALRDVQAAGADFMRKPYTPESLARKVRGVLHRAQTPRASRGARRLPFREES